jgi:hypothetical protein
VLWVLRESSILGLRAHTQRQQCTAQHCNFKNVKVHRHRCSEVSTIPAIHMSATLGTTAQSCKSTPEHTSCKSTLNSATHSQSRKACHLVHRLDESARYSYHPCCRCCGCFSSCCSAANISSALKRVLLADSDCNGCSPSPLRDGNFCTSPPSTAGSTCNHNESLFS